MDMSQSNWEVESDFMKVTLPKRHKRLFCDQLSLRTVRTFNGSSMLFNFREFHKFPLPSLLKHLCSGNRELWTGRGIFGLVEMLTKEFHKNLLKEGKYCSATVFWRTFLQSWLACGYLTPHSPWAAVLQKKMTAWQEKKLQEGQQLLKEAEK